MVAMRIVLSLKASVDNSYGTRNTDRCEYYLHDFCILYCLLMAYDINNFAQAERLFCVVNLEMRVVFYNIQLITQSSFKEINSSYVLYTHHI